MILIGARECDREAGLDEFTLRVDSRLTTPLILLIYDVPEDSRLRSEEALTVLEVRIPDIMSKAFGCVSSAKAIAFLLLYHLFRCFTGRHLSKLLPSQSPHRSNACDSRS
jgi:hypothetical protein